ncbi:RNA polymerase sigma-70 factor [Chitinophaga ginsengisoli]|uniref:RNA polymerase sigma-70 factor (ECF subfamily) n=1 Tax=Chitinophaga ginsengisoli TaxID=363837 RepID=A0A2P8G6X6_9BACT|nr:RNA polymerase sigma-70 factor [Chitinophaga ginsengisoli]PSL29724.1 RNA polymerase sigma-70 factor (ECF subfamily) [Chitinophaga ginsengisoli]
MSDNPSRTLFGQLFEANREKVYRLAFKLTSDPQRAEEITQQCFIKLWENMHKVQEGQDVFPLLFVFTKHIVIDETRKLYRERQSLSQLSSNQVSSENKDEEQLLRKEFRQQVHKLIEQMPEQRRNIYLLSRDKGKSYKEIADQLSLSPATVRNHLNLALQYIRREMMAHYDM